MTFNMLRNLAIVIALASSTRARDIVFPPIHPDVQYVFSNENNGPNLAGFDTPFVGLSTFANLPYVHCLKDAHSNDIEKYDIAVLGAPFDTGVTARPGARFGPSGIRWGSRRINPQFCTSVYTGNNTFREWARIVDCGNAPLTPLDNTEALGQLTAAHKRISSRRTNATKHGSVPRIITLGGDHTTTLPALRSTFDHFGPVSVLHFDSHIDTWDPNVLGGGISHYAGVNHGTFLHIAHEEGLILNETSMHAGIRAPIVGASDLKNDKRCGFDIIRARDIDYIGVKGIIEKIKERVNGTKVYISVDIDVLDPAFAPATGTAEVGGWTTRELLSILDGLAGLEVVGADVGKSVVFEIYRS